MKKQEVKNFAKRVFEKSSEDNINGRAAGLAFYLIFALVPLIIIVISSFGLFLSESTIESGMLHYFRERIGIENTQFFTKLLSDITSVEINTVASVIGLAVVLFVATNLFSHLMKTFSKIFELPPVKKENLLQSVVRSRSTALISMMVLVALLFAVVVTNITTSLFFGTIISYFEIERLASFFQILQYLLTFVISTLVFSAIYRFSSFSKITVKSAFLGGLVSALLYSFINILLVTYLGANDNFSVYGATGFFVAFLLWFYYVGVALFLGAEISQVHYEHLHPPEKPNRLERLFNRLMRAFGIRDSDLS